jgi:hypothetical protein
VDVLAGKAFTAFGTRPDIDWWTAGSGRIAMIAGDYGATYNSVMKGIPSGASFNLLRFETTGKVYTAPGINYVDVDASAKTKIDFTTWMPKLIRIVVTAQGNEAGNAKGYAVYTSGGVKECEVIWNGNALQTCLAGSWTTFSETTDLQLVLRVKGSSGTEDMTCYMAEMQFK